MKVHELIETLSKLPADADVIMSSDSEGNDYNMLYEAVATHRVADDPYNEYTPVYDDELDEYEEDEVELVEAVYLYP